MPEIPRSASYDAKAFVAELGAGDNLAGEGDIESALGHYRAALAIHPNSLAYDDLVYLLSFHPDFSDEQIARELAEWERQHARQFLPAIPPHRNNPDLNRPLKIGYVSPEFWRQAESHFVIPLLEAHNHEQFEIHCYSSVPKADDRTAQIRKLADVWHEVRELSDEALARKIRGDEIDILVDLSMHMRNSRMLTFARKPAPIQIAWLAYPGSTGLATMDYRLTDRYFDPPEGKKPFVESPWHLPDCWVCYDPLAQSALAPPRKAGPITFGSLNHPRKMNDVNLRLWAKLMKRVDGSRIILHVITDEHRKRATGVFQSEGISPDRLEFLALQPRWEYLRCYDRIDVALDTLPYSGITTTCDAIWMGTPVVTLVGQTTTSRGGLGILSTLGLPELVASSPAEFIEIAAKLAQDRMKLADYRKNLRQRIQSSPLMDAKRFAGNVEQAYRAMWLKYHERPAPESPETLNDRSVVLAQARRFEAAVAAAQEAIRLKPGFVEAYNNLGNALRGLGDYNGGIAAYDEAIRLNPNFTIAHLSLGNALMMMGQLDEAIPPLRKAIELNPEIPEAHNELANTLLPLGNVQEAIAGYREAVRLMPTYAKAHGNLLLAMNYLADVEPEVVYAEHRKWADAHATPLQPTNNSHANPRDPNRRLRIGFVSSDFRHHSVGHFLLPIFEHYNKQNIQISCYASVQRPDDFTDRIRRSCELWRDISGLSDEEIARQIRADGIDILVDLAGHTAGNRPKVFARKPAPIQVTYLGYANTTGMTAIDHRLTDALADPPGMTESLNAEKLWRLPACAWCFQPLESAPPVQPRQQGPIVFGSFNSFAKINRKVVATWAELLKAMPGSRLLLKSAGAGEESARRRLLDEFTQHGIPADRIEMLRRTDDFRDHLQIYACVDIALDTFPYNGTTTTCEALWMGVPAVSLAGRTHASRVGVSLLTQVGLSDLIAPTQQEYVSIASKLANDPSRLHSLRSTLRNRVASSPLTDGKRFASDLESAFREMWRLWCTPANPATIMPGPMSVQHQLQTAMAHHQAGKLAEAEKIYRQILASDPRNADALHLLGTLAGQCGNAPAGIQLIQQAIQSRPNYPEAYRNLGALLAAQSRTDEAIAAYQKIFQFRPNDADAHNDLGKVFAHNKQYEKAIAEFSTAIALNPRLADAHKKLGDVYRSTDRNDEAFAAYSKALELTPNWADAHAGAGECLRLMKKNDEAMDAYRRALQLDPKNVDALVGIGTVLCAKGGLDEAIKVFTAAIQLKPDNAVAYYNLGQAFRSVARLDRAAEVFKGALAAGQETVDILTSLATSLAMSQRLEEAMDYQKRAMELAPDASSTQQSLGEILLRMQKGDEAVAAFRRAVAADPKDATALGSLGMALRSQGKFDEAADCFRKAVELEPDSAMAYQNLAATGKLSSSKQEIDRLSAIVSRKDTPVSDEIPARFALARILDEGDLFDEAFAQYAAANALVKKQRAMAGEKYDREDMLTQVRQSIETFTPDFFDQHRGWGNPTEKPVFIVGMPRSGTTLLHQIAASHPMVHGAGELKDISSLAKQLEGPATLKELAADWSREKIESLALEQLKRFDQMSPTASRVVDKMPNNVMYLGIISLLYPNAKIILCRRDPLDTCLSCFFQWFSTSLTFSFDLADCGHFQRQTYRLMDHWTKALPLSFIEVHYEQVVADQEGQSRRLIDFLGLPWDPACLEFQKAKPEVLTASAWQVRQPLYNSSVGRWRNYERHLGPLFKELRD